MDDTAILAELFAMMAPQHEVQRSVEDGGNVVLNPTICIALFRVQEESRNSVTLC